MNAEVPNKICTHQFSPTEQFLFKYIICIKTLSLAFVWGIKRYSLGSQNLDSAGLKSDVLIKKDSISNSI